MVVGPNGLYLADWKNRIVWKLDKKVVALENQVLVLFKIPCLFKSSKLCAWTVLTEIKFKFIENQYSGDPNTDAKSGLLPDQILDVFGSLFKLFYQSRDT